MFNSLSQSLPDGKGDPEQNLWPLEENRVPDLQHRGRRQAGGEHGEEPLHSEHVGQWRLVAAWEKTHAWYLFGEFILKATTTFTSSKGKTCKWHTDGAVLLILCSY